MKNIDEIPHGHGLSFKKGVSDGILNENEFKEATSKLNHSSSYERGVELGQSLKNEVANKVKP